MIADPGLYSIVPKWRASQRFSMARFGHFRATPQWIWKTNVD
jgi:hypothetical protein